MYFEGTFTLRHMESVGNQYVYKHHVIHSAALEPINFLLELALQKLQNTVAESLWNLSEIMI